MQRGALVEAGDAIKRHEHAEESLRTHVQKCEEELKKVRPIYILYHNPPNIYIVHTITLQILYHNNHPISQYTHIRWCSDHTT
jgi:hypothetical protein